MTESSRILPEQVHEPEDRGKEEREPDQEDCVCRVVTVGVFGDNGKVRRRAVLTLRVNERSDQQHRRRGDQAERGNEPADVNCVRKSEYRALLASVRRKRTFAPSGAQVDGRVA